eukprot:1137015-Pelagomonas_calceolata.AAC.3
MRLNQAAHVMVQMQHEIKQGCMQVKAAMKIREPSLRTPWSSPLWSASSERMHHPNICAKHLPEAAPPPKGLELAAVPAAEAPADARADVGSTCCTKHMQAVMQAARMQAFASPATRPWSAPLCMRTATTGC